MIDERLQGHWLREKTARTRARAALPERWISDKRPEMRLVTDAFVEAITNVSVVRRLPSDER